MAVIHMPSGAEIKTFKMPPAGFDPAIATDKDIDDYGLPPRPVPGSPLLKNWCGIVGKPASFIEPTFQLLPGRCHGPALRHITLPPNSSYNWSGAVVLASPGQRFQSIAGMFTIPSPTAPANDGSWYYSSVWIGIDGTASPESNDVFQAGIAADINKSCSATLPTVFAWFEWYPENPVQITNFPVSPGNEMQLILTAISDTAGRAYIKNNATSQATTFQFSAPIGTLLQGNCAEWIVERPGQPGHPTPLANYGSVTFSGCVATDGSGTTEQPSASDALDMVDDSGQRVISTASVSATNTVQCTYTGPTPWADNDLSAITGGPASGRNALSGFTWGDFKQVVYFDLYNHTQELLCSPPKSIWTVDDLTKSTGAPLAGRNAIIGYTWRDYKQVVYLDDKGHAIELTCTPPNTWSWADLSSITGAPPAKGIALAAYSWGDFKQVVFLDDNGHVQELCCGPPAFTWACNDLTKITAAPPARQDGIGGYTWGAFKQVVFLDGGGHVQELCCGPPHSIWACNDLTAMTGALAADGFAIACYVWGSFKQVAFFDTFRHVQELCCSPPHSIWTCADLTSITKGPLAADNSEIAAYTWGGCKQVVFMDKPTGHIQEFCCSPPNSIWTCGDLSAIACAASALDVPITGYSWRDFKQVCYFGGPSHVHELCYP